MKKIFTKEAHAGAIKTLFVLSVCLLVGLILTRCSTAPTPAPAPIEVPEADPLDSRTRTFALVDASACAKYRWKDRSVAPIGFVRGVALSYQRSLCRLKRGEKLAQIQSQELTGSSLTDALTRYGFAKGMSPEERLTTLYALGIGLGMRESSGKFCEGRDTSAGAQEPSESEAGPFQASFNSMGTPAGGATSALYAEYQVHPEWCDLEVWREGVSAKDLNGPNCTRAINGPGTSAGKWQEFSRRCPAYATEHALTIARLMKNHFGPLNRKEAEFKGECFEMLAKAGQAASCE